MDDLLPLALGGAAFLAGAGFGAVFAWAWFERTARPRKLELKADQEFISSLNEVLIMAWLDSRGLVWQPKGIDFKVKAPKP